MQTEEEIRVREINNQLRKFSTLYSSNTFRIVAEILPYNAEEIIIRVSNMTLTEAQIEEGKARIEAYYKKQMAIEDMVVGDITFDTSMSSPDEKIAESRRQEKHTSSVTRGAQMEAYERYTNALFIADDMNVYRQRILQIIIRENKLTSPSLNQSPQKVFERQTAFLDLLEWASPSKSQTTESP